MSLTLFKNKKNSPLTFVKAILESKKWLLLFIIASLVSLYAVFMLYDINKNLEVLIAWAPFVFKGFLLNLAMSFFSMIIATILGLLLGLALISKTSVITLPSRAVMNIFRNSPWLVVLFITMYLFPFEVQIFGERYAIPGWWKATIAFSLPVMANIGEIFRGAVLSIPKSQWESAESLGFNHLQTMRYIIIPQCIKRALPSWMNWYALLTLATPMASILGVQESVSNTRAAVESAGAGPDLLFPFYLFLLALFFLYIYPIALLTRAIERNYSFKSQ